MKFNKWLQQNRQRMKLTQSELGKAIGVSRQTINYWECGRRPTFYIKQIQDLCKVLDCSFYDIPVEN
jgi:DNA-binding XRE family transcriptional regulator